MKRIFALSLLLSTAFLHIYADSFGEGFGVGAFTGLVGGAIMSKMASSNNPPAVYYNNPPTVYYVEDPYAEQKRMEIQMREEQIRMRELEHRRREREEEIRRREAAYHAQQQEHARRMRKLNRDTVIENTIVETRTIGRSKDKTLEIRERELALKEQQTQLALVKEQKELLREQNKAKELKLKEEELKIKLLKAQGNEHDLGIEKRVTKISKRTLTDTDPLSFVS